MSIKQEKITEPKVTAIKSQVVCDACSAVMSEDIIRTGFFDPSEEYTPSMELKAGWIEISRGSYGQRVKVHVCSKCTGSTVASLLSHGVN